MKTNLLLLLLCICSVPIFAQSPAWSIQNSGTSQDLRAVKFLDSQHGFVVGDSATLLETTDAGLTWQSLSLPNQATEHLMDLAFSSPDTGVVVSYFRYVYLTYDGGATWTEVDPVPGNCYWNRIAPDGNGNFLLHYEGCFGNQELYIFDPVSQTASQSMAVLQDFPQFSFSDSIYDVTTNAAGSLFAVGKSSMVLHSPDGGQNWQQIPFPDTAQTLRGIYFVDQNRGYIITEDLFYPRYVTSDGGLSWQSDSTWGPTFFYPKLYALDYHPSGNGLLAGWASGVSITDGIALVNDYSPHTQSFVGQILRGVVMVEDSLGWTVGDSGLIARYGPSVNVGIAEENVDTGLHLYPNPAQDQVHIRLAKSSLESSEFQLLDLQGRVLRTEQFTGNEVLVALHHLASGVYLIRVQTDHGNFTRELRVE